MYKYNSTIKVKCKCSPDCDKVPTLSCKGYFFAHLPEHLKDEVGTRKKVAKINHNKRVAISRKLYVDQKKINKEDDNLELWFRYQRQKLTGFCMCGCGLTSSKNSSRYYKYSCCHVLPKSKFESIATHPDNCIELNFWDGHHTTFDNMGYENCKEKNTILWSIVVEKFKKLYSSIAMEELKFIPNVLLAELINEDTPNVE